MNNPFFILSGPIQSGKTSTLMRQLEENPYVGGFACPVIEGKRFFYLFSEHKYVEMEADENDKDVLLIGRFRFRKSGFELASNQFELDLKSAHIRLVVLDEIGPLEVNGQGFADLISKLCAVENSPKIIIVVRDSLVDFFLTYFSNNGKPALLIQKEKLAQTISSEIFD